MSNRTTGAFRLTISEKQYIARTIKYQDVVLVNICDEELLGTTVKGDNVDMSISKDYFGGEKVSEDQAIRLVRGSSIVNLAGSRIVDRVLGERLASERAVKKVGQVSFLMIYKFSK
ncbi:MAG: DUF424 family protein [Thaumarchaeota archaeon]|nr:DUF424 family protein [Nitrososphaerota archaeon]